MYQSGLLRQRLLSRLSSRAFQSVKYDCRRPSHFSHQPSELSFLGGHPASQITEFANANRRSMSTAAAKTTPALEPKDFPSPFHHERAKYHNGKGSLKSSAWEVLKWHPKGLSNDDLISQIDKFGEYESKDKTQVAKELEDDIYFYQDGNSKWRLSIYQPLRWGIAGSAQIAEDVVEAMQLIPGVEVVAVAAGSSKEKAEGFAKEHGIKRAYGSYDDLAQDPDVDLVYISNLHPQHKDTVLAMTKQKKAILCEKPLSVNRKETQVMIDAAKEADVFFMAGLWSRFFPAQKMVKYLVESGKLGEVLFYEGRIFLQMGEETARLYDPEMGGGALLDIGLYMIALGNWVYGGGKPEVLQASAVLHKNGVDTTGSINLKYPHKGLAQVSYSMALNAPIEAIIYGDKGTLKVHDRAHNPTKLTFTPASGHEVLYEFPQPPKPDEISHGDAEGGWNFGGSMGFVYEVMAVHSAVVKGNKEIASVSNQEMLDLMDLTDQIRQQIGVSYPQDSKQQVKKTEETPNTASESK